MKNTELGSALMNIAGKINDFIEPMGGHVSGEIAIKVGRFSPAMTITIGFLEDRLKQYTAQDV
jgi:hypothetical protein